MPRRNATESKQDANTIMLIETSVNVKNMNERLFGGIGQPDGGAIHFIMNQHKELAAKLETNKQELLDKIDEKKKETDAAVLVISEAQDTLDRKVNHFTTVAATVNTLFLGAMGALGLYHKAHTGQ